MRTNDRAVSSTNKPSMFLTADELAELTGVKIGKNKKTREQLQSAELTRLRIPHYLNIAGRVIVARAVIEGRPAQSEAAEAWEPDPIEPSPPRQRKPFGR